MNYDIDSNQTGIHKDLIKIVEKHFKSNYQIVINELQQTLFDKLNELVKKEKRPLILDAGCGTGRSTYALADIHPNALIIGIDKSESRLNQLKDYRKSGQGITYIKKNAILMRADLIAQWHLMAKNNWQFEKIYLLYPNPYPKKSRIKQRFYAHAIFPYLMKLSNQFEVRSNWKLYLEEFEIAAKLCKPFQTELKKIEPKFSVTNFEEKYLNSKTELFQLQVLPS